MTNQANPQDSQRKPQDGQKQQGGARPGQPAKPARDEGSQQQQRRSDDQDNQQQGGSRGPGQGR